MELLTDRGHRAAREIGRTIVKAASINSLVEPQVRQMVDEVIAAVTHSGSGILVGIRAGTLVESNHYSTRPTKSPMMRFYPVRVGLRTPRDHHVPRHKTRL